MRRLQEALRTLEQSAITARKRGDLPWSRREVERHAKRFTGGSGLKAQRISEWLGDPGRAPRDPDQVWVLVQVWSAWAGGSTGPQDRLRWNQLVELAQPLYRSTDRDGTSSSGSEPGGLSRPSTPPGAREPARADRRRWLPLERGIFPVLQDTDAARTAFAARLRDALVETFGDRQARFTLTLRSDVPDPEESGPALYEVWCHEREFVARAAQRHRERLTWIIEARLRASDVEATRQALLREIIEAEHAMADWRVEVKAVFLNMQVAHTVTYDPALHRVRIEANPHMGDGDDGVSTTSEVLAFVCRPVKVIEDLFQHSTSRPLGRLYSHLLDHRMDFERFRVAQDDTETWDYR